MHRLLFVLVFLIGVWQIGYGQLPTLPLDTLLHDFTDISDITPLKDGSFIIIGTHRGAVRVSRINSNTNSIWTQTLTDTIFYRIQDFEIHLEENDSTIQVLILKTECDIIPAGVATLFTILFDGNIKDIVAIPFESTYETIFLLSGNDSLPRVASITGDSIILRYATGDLSFLNKQFDFFPPRLVDMAPSGKIIVQYNIGFLRIYTPVDGQYTVSSGGYSNPFAQKIIFVGDNHIVLLEENYISAIDSNGYELNLFKPSPGYLFDIKYKSGFFYTSGFDFVQGADSFYVLNMSLNRVYAESPNYPPYISNIAIDNERIYRTGHDSNYPYPNAYLEIEDLESHEGPKYYDIELVHAQLDSPDSLAYFKKCGQHYMYYFPSITFTLKNNSDFTIDKSTVGYDFN